ncbi:MAG: hypothetical protein ABI661_09750 [Gammaproteobacteria bacterium]
MAAVNIKYYAVALVLLLVSNLVLGVVSFGFIQQLDQRYGQLLDNSLPLLNQVRALSWEVTQVQRSINRYPQYDADGRQGLMARRARATVRASELLNLIRNRDLPRQLREPLLQLETAQAEVTAASTRWEGQIRSGDLAAAQSTNLTAVQPAYEDHARILEDLALVIEKNGTEMNNLYSAGAGRSGTIVLAMAAWPFLAGLLALALGAIGMYLLLPLVRRLETELRR